MKGIVDEETEDDFARFCAEVRAGKYPDSDDDTRYTTGHDSDSQGYDWRSYYDITLCARLGLHCYNSHKGTHYQFKSVSSSYTDRLDMADPELRKSFITLEAMNPADNSPLTFRTCVKHNDDKGDVTLWWETFFCVVKDCEEEETDHEWSEAIDERYKGEMPEWLSDLDQQQRYVLQESELRDVDNNGWLHLFTEFAFYTKWRGMLDPRDIAECVELDTQEVVVETRGEAGTEPRDMLKAANAIFYISFQCADDPETDDLVNYRAVVRKTMDGKPGHMRLEVRCFESAKESGSEESGSEESDSEESDAEGSDSEESDPEESDPEGSDAEDTDSDIEY